MTIWNYLSSWSIYSQSFRRRLKEQREMKTLTTRESVRFLETTTTTRADYKKMRSHRTNLWLWVWVIICAILKKKITPRIHHSKRRLQAPSEATTINPIPTILFLHIWDNKIWRAWDSLNRLDLLTLSFKEEQTTRIRLTIKRMEASLVWELLSLKPFSKTPTLVKLQINY